MKIMAPINFLLVSFHGGISINNVVPLSLCFLPSFFCDLCCVCIFYVLYPVCSHCFIITVYQCAQGPILDLMPCLGRICSCSTLLCSYSVHLGYSGLCLLLKTNVNDLDMISCFLLSLLLIVLETDCL